MIFIGIDISKYKHDCVAVCESGELVIPCFSFDNNAIGFATFLSKLTSLKDDDIRIGFEATAHYGLNLKLFLEKNKFSFMEFNPLFIHKFVNGITLRKTKTDKIDCFSIAKYLSTVDYKPYPTSFYYNLSLKSLTRLRDKLIRQRSGYLVRITNVLDRIFPEFKPFFKNKLSTTALYILTNYSIPDGILNMNSKSQDILRRKSKGHFSMMQFVKLKELAKNTVGESNEIYQLELNSLLKLYNNLKNEIEKLEVEISKLIIDIDPPTLSIKGIGPISAAIIVSEYGDFKKFSNSNKMLAFAGLEPSYFQSGTSEHFGKMVKRGSSLLRYTILNCCSSLFLHNEVFAQYYYKKIGEGKSHNVAKSHLAKKLIRIIFTLETKNIKFNPELLL